VEKETWYSYQLSQDELKTFVDNAKIKTSNEKAFIGLIELNVSQRIEALCGKKAERIILESSAIRHSYKKVNHNLRDDDLLHLVSAVNTATDIKISSRLHQNNECLEICKDINGKITFIMEIRTHYGGCLALATCYRLKK
jgi:hypothetical protein